MKLKENIIERLEELDGTHIPMKVGGRTKYGEAKSLLLILEVEHGSLIKGKRLDLEEYIPDE